MGCIAWTLYGTAVLFVLMMTIGGALMPFILIPEYDSHPYSTNEALLFALIGAAGFAVVYTCMIGLPLFLIGRALSNGSGAVRTLIVIISWILILLVPTVVGPIIGIVLLFLLNQGPTQRWFEMRKIKRSFAR